MARSDLSMVLTHGALTVCGKPLHAVQSLGAVYCVAAAIARVLLAESHYHGLMPIFSACNQIY